MPRAPAINFPPLVKWSGYRWSVFALLLVAISVGLDNFAAATAIGVFGVDRNLRLRVALIFGIFEAGMPLVGLALGNSMAHGLGTAAQPIAGAVLGLVGVYAVASELIAERGSPMESKPGTRRLVMIGGALSVDNLAIGFALGVYHLNLIAAAVIIAVVSVALSLLGLEIGSRLAGRLGQRGGLVGGLVLIVLAVAIGTGLL
jgi:putative Mn2+ efflux pump MntP